MANIVTLPKFVGSIDLNTSNENIAEKFALVIADKELGHIERLLGRYSAKRIYAEAGFDDKFEPIDDFEANPDFDVFFNGGWFKDTEGNDIHTEGFITILAYCLYSDLLFAEEKVNTSMGNIAMKERKSTYSLTYEKVSQEMDKVVAWNIHVDLFDRFAEYLCNNETLFPSNWVVTKQQYLNVYGI